MGPCRGQGGLEAVLPGACRLGSGLAWGRVDRTGPGCWGPKGRCTPKARCLQASEWLRTSVWIWDLGPAGRPPFPFPASRLRRALSSEGPGGSTRACPVHRGRSSEVFWSGLVCSVFSRRLLDLSSIPSKLPRGQPEGCLPHSPGAELAAGAAGRGKGVGREEPPSSPLPPLPQLFGLACPSAGTSRPTSSRHQLLSFLSCLRSCFFQEDHPASHGPAMATSPVLLENALPSSPSPAFCLCQRNFGSLRAEATCSCPPGVLRTWPHRTSWAYDSWDGNWPVLSLSFGSGDRAHGAHRLTAPGSWLPPPAPGSHPASDGAKRSCVRRSRGRGRLDEVGLCGRATSWERRLHGAGTQ